MDSFNFQNIKVEKANAKIRNRRLQKVTTLFRLMELCVFLIILSRVSTLLPVAFKFSGEFFRGFFLSLLSPRFVFILGNLIVITLFVKSGNSSAQDQISTNNSKNDFYDEYVESCQRNSNQTVHNEEGKKQKQQSISPGKALISRQTEKRMHRSLSENLKSSNGVEPRHVLRRTVTEKCLESVNNEDRTVATASPVDEMSNDEFRSRVEAFIARQQRLIKQEEEEEITDFVDLVGT